MYHWGKALTQQKAEARKRVLLIHTGGTLGMQVPQGTRLDLGSEQQLERMLQRVPELGEMADLDLIAPWNLDSSDVGPRHWRELAQLIVEEGGVGRRDAAGELEGYHGIVVIHGTDTLSYTASALSFMLRGLDRPVVLSGSQRPLEAWRSDARTNLASAVECATLEIPEVVVVFGDRVLRGNRSAKIDATSYSAFGSPSVPEIAKIGTDLEVAWRRVRRPERSFCLQPNLDSRVLALTVFPGMNPRMVRQAVLAAPKDKRIKALVIRGFGVGNVPTQGPGDLRPLIESFGEAGIPIVIMSQCYRGHVDMRVYPSGRELLAAGAITARDMTFEAAITKTMWALGQPEKSLAQWFDLNLAGEVTL